MPAAALSARVERGRHEIAELVDLERRLRALFIVGPGGLLADLNGAH